MYHTPRVPKSIGPKKPLALTSPYPPQLRAPTPLSRAPDPLRSRTRPRATQNNIIHRSRAMLAMTLSVRAPARAETARLARRKPRAQPLTVRSVVRGGGGATRVAGARGDEQSRDGAVSTSSAAASSAASTSLATTPAAAVSALALWSLADGGLAEGTANSYYATLFLFVLSAPGLYSLVKRSAKSKVARKSFELDGPAVPNARSQDDIAREVSGFFRRNNYVVAGEPGEVITFEGNIAPERGTAAYITFCVLIGLLCIGLVCSIALPGGDAWYALALVSPLSGKYYLDNAGRKEQVKVKMVTSDDDKTTEITVEGDPEEIERFRRELDLTPKGMVRVKGILESA